MEDWIEWMQSAQELEEQGEVEEALQVYTRLVKEGVAGRKIKVDFAANKVPGRFITSCAANCAGGIYLETGEILKARRLFEKSLSSWDENAMALLNLANLENEHDSPARALEIYERVLELWHISNTCNRHAAAWVDVWVVQPLQQCAAIACIMAATLYHQFDLPERAVPLLQLLGCSFRLAPQLFNSQQELESRFGQQGPIQLECSPAPVRLHEEAISRGLHDALAHAFRPDSPYWEETDYKERGYFSFWYDVGSKPSNLVEVMIRRLLALVGRDDIVGAEWWIHTRKGNNSAHQCHFDTEENHLQDGQIVHPVVSSVVYLSGTDFGGPTLVLDQCVDQSEGAQKAVLAYPRDRAFLVFPGNALHCVLPPNKTALGPQASNMLRTTLMVGFWDTNVHRKGKRHRLGPCSRFPRHTRETSWVSVLDIPPSLEIGQDVDYGQACPGTLCTVSPAWEPLPSRTASASFSIPFDYDKRFFVESFDAFSSQAMFENRC